MKITVQSEMWGEKVYENVGAFLDLIDPETNLAFASYQVSPGDVITIEESPKETWFIALGNRMGRLRKKGNQ